MRIHKIIGMALVVGLLTHVLVYAKEAAMQDEEQTDYEGTPPRLSFVDGQVSFWRTGAPDWVEAEINTPLAPGDQLYTGESANLELQIDNRAFVRAGADTQIGLENLESNYTQFKVTAGYVSLDIRDIDPEKTVEVDAPNAAFIINHPGYYRVDVDGEHTSITVRGSGEATVTPAAGEPFQLFSGEQAALDGTTAPEIKTYQAHEIDQWDQWGLSRTDEIDNSMSARYVSPGIYGTSDLDDAGEWRKDPEYGNVWIPTDVPEEWAPYSSGSWINDPVYGTTWVDSEPWGWAPYHYGRWVSLDGQWAWAPGPPVRRPAYAPALVAFLGNQDSVERGDGGPMIAWVPLGWGEPLVPWWGPERFHRPWWGGWGGPRFSEVEHTGRYRNMDLRNGIIMVHERQFGQGPVRSLHGGGINRGLRPMQADSVVSRIHENVLPTEKRGIRPPASVLQRSVVATRPPRSMRIQGENSRGPTGYVPPAPRIVQSTGPVNSDASRHHSPMSTVLRPEAASRIVPPLPSGMQQTVRTPGNRMDSNGSQQRFQTKTPQSSDEASQPPPPPHRGETGRGEPSRVGHGSAIPEPQQDLRSRQQPDVPSNRSLRIEQPEADHGPANVQPQGVRQQQQQPTGFTNRPMRSEPSQVNPGQATSQPQERVRPQPRQQIQPANQPINRPAGAGHPQTEEQKRNHKPGERTPEN